MGVVREGREAGVERGEEDVEVLASEVLASKMVSTEVSAKEAVAKVVSTKGVGNEEHVGIDMKVGMEVETLWDLLHWSSLICTWSQTRDIKD